MEKNVLLRTLDTNLEIRELDHKITDLTKLRKSLTDNLSLMHDKEEYEIEGVAYKALHYSHQTQVFRENQLIAWIVNHGQMSIARSLTTQTDVLATAKAISSYRELHKA